MLRNWPIRSKLVVILIVPLVALAVLSAIQVRGNVDNVRDANRIKALADFSIKSSDLVHAIAQERYSTNSFVGSGYSIPALEQPVLNARGPVDDALAVYRDGEASLPADAREALAGTLTAIRDQLARLPEHRAQIDARQMTVVDNIAYYDGIVKDLLLLNASVAVGSRDTELVNAAAALASIGQAKEQAAQQRGNVAMMLFLGQVSPQVIQQVIASIGAEEAWLTEFRTTATPAQQDFYNSTVEQSAGAVAQLRSDILTAIQSGQRPVLNPQDWLNTSDAKIAEMRAVERRVATDLGATSEEIASAATREALIGSIAVAVVLVLSVIISLLVASPMINQLRRLRRDALETANTRLPQVVERLHRGEAVDVSAEAFPLTNVSKDEIGQVAEAFATVHEVAVRTAVEQAAMRKSIGDTFLNLARRSQALIHRQLKVIDALERKETDPDELEELFRLDHLATRMRRHAEDLIVLSGSKPARGWRRPVPIKDVVRGAVAEVEDYTRVKVLPIGGGAISGHAVGDVIHMLAELIENATSFSPPHTPVQVSGHEVSNGYVIEVEDRGLGMSEEEFAAINERLSNPPPFDLSTSERLGLFVVSKLAERHKVQVRLRSSPYGGTMAIVLLPQALLRPAEDNLPGQLGATRELATVGAVSQDAQLDTQTDQVSWSADAPAGSSGSGSIFSGLGGRPADEPLIDDLPVFATVRSSWFVSDRPRRRTSPADGTLGTAPSDEEGAAQDLVPSVNGFHSPNGGSDGNGPGGGGPGDPGPDGAPSGDGQFTEDRSRRDAEGADAVQPGYAQTGYGQTDYSRVGGGLVPAADLGRDFSRDHSRDHSRDFASRADQDFAVDPLLGRGFRSDPGPGIGDGLHRRRRMADPLSTDQSADPLGGGEERRAEPEVTEVGLPKRRRRASLAPQLRRENVAKNRSAVAAGPRSPEEIRSMMTSFQSNFGRGLQDGAMANDGDDVRKVT